MNNVRRVVCAIAVLLFGAAPLRAQGSTQPMWIFVGTEPAHMIAKIEATGAQVRYTSRWLGAVSVNADASVIARIRKLPDVIGVQPVGKLYAARASGSTPGSTPGSSPAIRSDASAMFTADFDSAFYGPNFRAIRDLGIPSSHTLGFTGRNIRIAILDTGFDLSHETLALRRVIAQRDFINGDAVVSNQPGEANSSGPLDQEVHGTAVWSLLGGHAPGKVVGPAYDAHFILAKVDLNQPGTEDVAADEDRWVAAVEWADSMGARIINSSLTYREFSDKADYPTTALDGKTTLATRMADEAARRGILVVNAVGNAPLAAPTLGAPADADSIIAVGAVNNAGEPAVFANDSTTARGPTTDGRLKPELVALGVGLVVAHSENPQTYSTGQGTSYAAPFIAGGAAMFMQAWPNLTIMAVRNALMLSGSRAEFPDNNVGYGVPNISGAILFPEGLIPVGITGVNLQNQLTTIQPTFTWSAPLVNQQMLPVRYRLEIATDPAFTNILYSDTTSGSSLTVKRPLQPAAARFWRVVAEAFPNIRRTTRATSPFSVPDWVRLLTLTEPNSVTDSLRPTLRWEALAAPAPSGPLTFDVQILSGQTGAIIANMTGLTTTSAQPLVPLTPNIPFRWRVIARSPTGLADTVQTEHVFLVTSTGKPPATLLYQNFPNPFPRSDLGVVNTRIWFDVNERSEVELAVYDIRGRLIRQLIPALPSCGGMTLEPGIYGRSESADACVVTQWDGRDVNGEQAPRGVYILRLRAGGTDQVKKIVYAP